MQANTRSTSSTMGATREIHSYAELQQQLHNDLLAQHPEWIDSNGNCPTCDEYDRRFAKLISIFESANAQS